MSESSPQGGAQTQTTASFSDAVTDTVVAGHIVIRELARGGFGVVYLARHQFLGELRAIKRPQTRGDRDPEIARFRREVQAMGAVRGDHLIRAHDAGADDDGPYLVMEYLDGAPLSRLAGRGRTLTAAEACALVRQAALGLQAAHERGLVHRDVKPSNLMLARVNTGARVVVIDWGLVRFMSAGETPSPAPAGATGAGVAMGTPDYIAPEQASDARTADIRADIYSLGVTLYHLLAGQPPFHDRPKLDKLVAHQRETFPALGEVRPDIPNALLAILAKMVEKEPAQRFETPSAVAGALQPFCCADADLLALLDAHRPELPLLPAPRRRRSIAWVLGAAGCLAAACLMMVAAASGWLLLGRTPHGSAGVLGDGPAAPASMTERHSGLCTSIAFTSDGLHAVSESGGADVFVWDLQKRRLKKLIHHILQKPYENYAGVVAAAPDGETFAAAGVNGGMIEMKLSFGNDGHMNLLSLYDQQDYTRLVKDIGFARMSSALAFSPDGARLAAVELGVPLPQFLPVVLKPNNVTLRLIDVKTLKTKEFPLNGPVNGLAFSPPDGRFLVTCSDEKILRLWNLATGKQERQCVGHTAGVDQVAFSADGKRIYSASSADDTLRVWKHDADAAPSELAKIPLDGVPAKMICCAFWSGGRAWTGHVDGSVVLWDLATGKELYRHTHKDGRVTAVAVSPDGHHAVAALADHQVYLHRLPPPWHGP